LRCLPPLASLTTIVLSNSLGRRLAQDRKNDLKHNSGGGPPSIAAREVRPWPPIRSPRLEVVRREHDCVFGDGHAAAHPELVIAVVNAASSDRAAARLALAIERVAEALLVEEEAQRIVPARELRRARP
jgi:hypothetical protein